MFQTRSDELHVLGEKNPLISSEDTLKPSARMCHTLTDLKNGHLLLIGGRTRPGFELSDVWVYNEQARVWKQVGDIGEGMARHSAINFGENRVLVFSNGKFKIVTYAEDKFDVVDLTCTGSVPNLKSCSLSYNSANETFYVVGGMLEEFGPTINDALYSFTVHGTQVTLQVHCSHPHFARIGCLSTSVGQHLYIIGGAGNLPQNQESTILGFDLLSNTFHGMRIPDNVWKTYPVFIGSQIAGNSIVGGGAVCYSFGSCYNNSYLLEIPESNV
ncbi:hypothetical protein JCM33374_g6555 [Metschnikowia sp. JCM 33374]|nr:hypothetical protein JCM33374_g6555 [Metschnikowia sp. JCM 33374]